MISPETSTNVATNGAEDVAGSIFKLRKRKGSMEPASEPQSTIPTRAMPTVNASKNQCSPYESNNTAQSAIRAKPNVPNKVPRDKPVKNSRRITRHQSRRPISPSAMARMINVDACEPELPPLEITRGIKMESTTALAISCSYLPIAVAVNISLRKRMINQLPRLRTMLDKAICIYGSSNASEPPI